MMLNLVCIAAMGLFYGVVLSVLHNEVFFYFGMDFFFMIWDYVMKWLFNVVLSMMDEEERDVFYRVVDDLAIVIKDLNNLVKTIFNFNGVNVNEHYAMVQGDAIVQGDGPGNGNNPPGNGNNPPGNGNNPPGNGNNGPGERQGDSRIKVSEAEMAMACAIGFIAFFAYNKWFRK